MTALQVNRRTSRARLKLRHSPCSPPPPAARRPPPARPPPQQSAPPCAPPAPRPAGRAGRNGTVFAFGVLTPGRQHAPSWRAPGRPAPCQTGPCRRTGRARARAACAAGARGPGGGGAGEGSGGKKTKNGPGDEISRGVASCRLAGSLYRLCPRRRPPPPAAHPPQTRRPPAHPPRRLWSPARTRREREAHRSANPKEKGESALLSLSLCRLTFFFSPSCARCRPPAAVLRRRCSACAARLRRAFRPQPRPLCDTPAGARQR